MKHVSLFLISCFLLLFRFPIVVAQNKEGQVRSAIGGFKSNSPSKADTISKTNTANLKAINKEGIKPSQELENPISQVRSSNVVFTAPEGSKIRTEAGSIKADDSFNFNSRSNVSHKGAFQAVDKVMPPPTQSLRFDDSYIHTCHECNGQGTLSIREPCESCLATGSLVCGVCSGKGNLTCHECYGKGNENCILCGGTGRGQQVNQAISDILSAATQTQRVQAQNTPCVKCSGRGKVKCKSCRGAGIEDCRHCSGDGKVGCDDCTGGYINSSHTCPRCDGAKQVANW